jgi:glutathione peroxidase
MRDMTRTIDRRGFLLAAAGTLAAPAAPAQEASRITAYAFSFPALEGQDIRLADHGGKPLLVVNTASQCGYTPQLAGLQKLFTRFRDRGLLVLGVPSNDYDQEPGHGIEIAREANEKFGVTFPLTVPVALKGPKAHPFYKWAATERPWRRHAGTSTSISSAATDISPPCS